MRSKLVTIPPSFAICKYDILYKLGYLLGQNVILSHISTTRLLLDLITNTLAQECFHKSVQLPI